jgi:isoleucyl-tRNA synthetase
MNQRRLRRRLKQVLNFVTHAYENFEFSKAYKGIYDFCNEDLSMYYLDMAKGRLYTDRADSVERRAAQTTIYHILSVLVRVIAPILAFTAEEIWQHMPKEKKDKDITSVHLLDWPGINITFAQDDLSEEKDIGIELKPIIELISDVAKLLEEKRSLGDIGSSFDGKINLLTNEEKWYKYLKSLKDDLIEILKVSQVEIIKKDKLEASLVKNSNYPNIGIEVTKAEGAKCMRCWNYSLSIGSNKTHPQICDKCLVAIGGK